MVLGFALCSILSFAEEPAKNVFKQPSGDFVATVASLAPQPTPSPTPRAASASSSMRSENTPAAEAFVGYLFTRFNPPGPNFNVHGGAGSIAGNVNDWFGLVAEFSGSKVSDLPQGAGANIYSYLFGPQFSRRSDRVTTFFHALFGAARLSVDNPATVVAPGSPLNATVHDNAFAAAFGLGFDVNLSKHVAWRVAQADYLLTTFRDIKNDRQDNFRAATGLVFRFGMGPPPPPPNHAPTVSTTAEPTKVIAGESAVVRAQANDPDNDQLTYTWTATGGKVDGSGPEVHWNSADAAPGNYTVTVKVDDGRGGTATSSTQVSVEPRPNRAPTVSSCAANPATVTAGQPVEITATASDPDNDQLTYSYSATGGKVSGTGAQAQFDSTGLAPGHYTVTCHVDDGKGGVADGTADVEVQAPAPPPEQRQLEVRLSLHSIYFPTAQPTVQNPGGGLLPSQQRTLTALASDFQKYLSYKPDAHLILQGHADPRGGPDYNKALSDRRVERTKSFLVEHGVPADHIDTQGLGEEQPMSADQVKQAVDQDPNLSDAEKRQLTRNARVLALAQSRRVDVTLSTTGQTSVRQFPFNAADALNLINPKGTSKAKPAAKGKKKAPAKKKPPAQ
jgi:outer membrane protein OmpA-like peptidoglycan-associated protein